MLLVGDNTQQEASDAAKIQKQKKRRKPLAYTSFLNKYC